MNKRDYYSVRTGKIEPNEMVNLKVLTKLFLIIYKKLEEEGYYQKYFGFWCEDMEDVPGKLGYNMEDVMFIHLKKENLYPIHTKIEKYSEDDFFDVLEFLHDYCSKGIDGYYHQHNGCGYHYEEFNDKQGQRFFRELVNPILKDYSNGFELSNDGEILQLADSGLSHLFEADVPASDETNIVNKVNNAVLKFRRYKSTMNDRQNSIRELVDVLEYLRPKAKELLETKDEKDLFNIANNYGIRHHNQQQKDKYDVAIWHSWMFYHYLATIHALLRLINKTEK